MSQYCSYEDCNRFAFINGICYSHDKEEKREAKEKLKVKKVYKIPAKSKNKAKEDSQYGPLRKKFLEEYPMCNASINGECGKPAVEIHHVSLSGTNFLNTETWVGCCIDCHRIIETVLSAEERRLKGLLTD